MSARSVTVCSEAPSGREVDPDERDRNLPLSRRQQRVFMNKASFLVLDGQRVRPNTLRNAPYGAVT